MKKSNSFAAFAAIALLLVIGCKVEPDSIAVESIELSETTLTLAPGATKTLTATVMPDNADDKTVIWRSSNETFATVDNNGTVTAHAKGTATITAKAGDKTAECKVTVCVHSFSGGKCTVCGAIPYLAGGEIDENGVLTKYWYGEATVVIPDGVTSIGYRAFALCTYLEIINYNGTKGGMGKDRRSKSERFIN